MPYRSNPRLADLLLQQGDIAAQRAMAGGQAWGNAVSSIGNRVGSTITAMQQQKANAPRQAMQDEMDQLSIEGKRRQFAAEDRQLSEQDQAQAVMKVSDWLTEIASAPDPETQAATYQAGRAALLESGIFTPQDAPEFFPGQSWVKAKMMRTLPAAERFKQLYPTDKDAPKLIERDPTKDLAHPITGEIVTKGTPKPESKPNPTEASLALEAAQGNDAAKQALALIRAQHPKPQGPQPDYEWVIRDGKPAQIRKGTAQPGDSPYRAPQSISESAQDRQRSARTDAARDFLVRLNELRGKINTKMGPSAGMTGMARRAGASMGMDPDVAEYERIRAAGGRALAVAIMGAQNLSDADANAWANMLPDARTDEQTAGRLTTQVERMLEGMTGDAKASQAAPPSAPKQAPAASGRVYYDADGNPVKKP